MFTRSGLLTTALAVALALPAPLLAQAGGDAASGDVVVNMRDIDIADVAEQISRITGRTLILDPQVRGTVNVSSATPLSPEGVWDLFQSVLRAQGFAAIRSGRVWRIVGQANAARDGGIGTHGRGAEVVTRLIRLHSLAPDQAVRVFKPLVAQFGSVEALTSPNAIVVTDYADNVRRIQGLAAALDGGAGAEFQAITLKYGTAEDVANAIRAVLGDGGQAGGPRIAADPRSNIVLIRGEASAMREARRIASALDQPGGAAPTTRVFRLANSDAESLTEVLRGLLGEGATATNPVARALTGGRTARSLGAGRTGTGSAASTTPSSASLASSIASGAPPAAADPAKPTPEGFATPDLAIQPAPELNAIVVRGTPSAIAQLEPIITELDVRRPQVMIEAAIVEINSDDAEQLGVQLGLGSAAPPGIGSGAATNFSSLDVPYRTLLSALGSPAAAGIGNGLNINVGNSDFRLLVQALGTSTRANLLSTPSLTVLDNEPAEIVVGQNVPFRTGSFGTDGNSVNPFTTIERQDVGITLRVVPRVNSGDVVKLEVSQEVSALTNAVTGAADLVTNRRSIQTTVLADNGETIVLGGLISDDRMRVNSKVPLLGDVPLLGELFKARKESQAKKTLFVFLRPTILRDTAAAVAATRAKYGRLQGEEANLSRTRSLLLSPPPPRLTVEIDGLY
ncbi:type II secretion system secretin GspD [Sphingomonas flavalba]|uniref:type II secretion system secretin GspD n=1 Tax=Sphingomonas flavalba TaxID=2559804 RepID=UPI00109E1735|nr:type II secretion system secretin GspD [Sphingomonas flavalba]